MGLGLGAGHAGARSSTTRLAGRRSRGTPAPARCSVVNSNGCGSRTLTADPALLLCDEPLASPDPANQQLVVELIDARAANAGTAVVP